MPLLVFGAGADEQRFPLFKNITRIGSSPASDITLVDATVAKDHGHILRKGDEYVVASLGRGRPVFVNGKKEKRAVLCDGDAVGIGDVELTFYVRLPEALARSPQAVHANAYQQIVHFSEQLLRTEDLDALLTSLMDSVIEITRANKGFLILFEDGRPDVRVARNIKQENLNDAIAELSDSILAKVVREQQPVIVNDALNDKEFKACTSVMNLKVSSVMCVPLTEGAELIGLIYLGSDQVAALFQASMLEAVTVFAGHASLLIQNAILLNTLREDNKKLRKAVTSDGGADFGNIIGTSSAMEDVFRKIRKVSPTDIPVLITGETGTGKELVARALHQHSDRAKRPFVVVNCGAIPENLLESELFGHVKGAFTGAVKTREGRFQAADSGTLFLDEIGEMAPSLQVKLLRALQEKIVTRVGETQPESVDIRIVAATNRNLEEEITTGGFREDLYYRLNVVGIHLPALRERDDDLMLIARFLLKNFAEQYHSSVKGFSPQCVLMMKKFGWPGNIRQLENRLKKAIIMTDRTQLTPEDLELSNANLQPVVPLTQAKEAFQRAYINEVLARNNGNRTKTAQDLGVDPRTIFRHLEREESMTRSAP